MRQIYRGRIVDLRVERVTLPNGTAVDLELMHHPGASAVVAVDDDGRVVLLRQYRHAAGGYLWELPAGVLDAPDEPPRACAARELTEEAARHEADEVIAEIARLPFAEALAMIRGGEIVDGKTIAGLHLAAAVLAAA